MSSPTYCVFYIYIETINNDTYKEHKVCGVMEVWDNCSIYGILYMRRAGCWAVPWAYTRIENLDLGECPMGHTLICSWVLISPRHILYRADFELGPESAIEYILHLELGPSLTCKTFILWAGQITKVCDRVFRCLDNSSFLVGLTIFIA
jgi:hypothetical protein